MRGKLRNLEELSKEMRYMSVLKEGNTKLIIFALPFLGIKFDDLISLRNVGTSSDDNPEFDGKLMVSISIPLSSAIKCCIKLDGSINEEQGKCECEFYDIVKNLTSHKAFNTCIKDVRNPLVAIYVYDILEEWKEDFNNIMKSNFKKLSEEHKARMAICYEDAPGKMLKTIEEVSGINLFDKKNEKEKEKKEN